MKVAREAWFACQLDLDPDAPVFINETAAATSMTQAYGRAPGGERSWLLVPRGHYKTAVTAALNTSGLVATTLFDGATNGKRFRAYVTDILCSRPTPARRQHRPGTDRRLDHRLQRTPSPS